MRGKDEIKNLFSDKLGSYQVKVNSELWANIASQVGAGTTVVATGMALTTKIIIGLSAASVITVASFLAVTSVDGEQLNKEFSQIKISEEEKSTQIVEKSMGTDVIVEKPLNVVIVSDSTLEPLVIEPLLVGPVLAPITKPVVSPKQRVVMQADPIQNIFIQTEDVMREDAARAIVEADPVLSKTPKEDLITNESTVIKVFFPNVFTPNGDGTNDLLFISNPEELDQKGFVLQIVDESFKTVFTSTDPNFEWNGNDLGGEPAKKGHYIAIITSKDKNGNEAKPVMYQFEVRK